MIKRFSEGEISTVIPSKISVQKIHGAVAAKAKDENITLPSRDLGVGTFEWKIEGEGWKSFAKADKFTQSDVAEIYEMRKSRLLSMFAQLPEEVRKGLFTVPNTDCIFYREVNDDDYEFALAGWGHKYPDRSATSDLRGYIIVREKQNVNIAFLWDGKKVPNTPFKIKGYSRTTDKTGILNFGKPIPVGNQYPIEKPDGTSEVLEVEKGRADYFYDMTQYMQAEVSVFQDGGPVAGKKCSLRFHDKAEDVLSGEDGKVVVKFPLVCGLGCVVKQPQPKCMARCGARSDEKTPTKADEILHFKFDYVTPPPQMTVEIEAVQDNFPAANRPCTIKFGDKVQNVTTDSEGRAIVTMEMPCFAPGKIIQPQPVCSVTLNNETQERTPLADGETLKFMFNFSTPQPTVEVNVKVLQDGYPSADKICSISFNDKLQDVTTGPDGKAVLVLPLKCDGAIHPVKPQPVCTVKCNGETQELTPDNIDGQVLNFEFTFKTPKFVSIKLKDYGGYPLPDLDFVLTTKLKGSLSLRTDSNGVYMAPQEWFMPGEKINVKFDITPEYRATHELHDPLDKKSHFWNFFFKSKAKSKKE